VIDYALAKGLAHEAFGHASEADAFRSSILAKDGRFRVGDEVGPAHVSIVDETLPGDHAWQPFSPNGLARRRTTIVSRGRLHEALSDPWSAAESGVAVTGAERAESYRHAPVPRMSNIRIEVEGALPAPGPSRTTVRSRCGTFLRTPASSGVILAWSTSPAIPAGR
jgi:TldD protein